MEEATDILPHHESGWLPVRWERWRPWRRHPARVEEVGLVVTQVYYRGKGGAGTPLSRKASLRDGVLEGEQAGGGGEAEGF